jgi:hypothetical protein
MWAKIDKLESNIPVFPSAVKSLQIGATQEKLKEKSGSVDNTC